MVRQSNELGYLEEEVEALILLLQTRGLAEVKQDWLFEVYAEALSTEEVRQQLRDLERDLALLADGFESSQLNEWRQQVENSLRPRLNELVRDKTANPNDVAMMGTNAAPTTEKQPLTPQAQRNIWCLFNRVRMPMPVAIGKHIKNAGGAISAKQQIRRNA